MPVENRRRYARYPVQGAFGRLWSPMDVKLVNLSRSGVALETTHELQAGDSYVVEVSHRDRQVSMELQIRWCGRHSAFTHAGRRRAAALSRGRDLDRGGAQPRRRHLGCLAPRPGAAAELIH